VSSVPLWLDKLLLSRQRVRRKHQTVNFRQRQLFILFYWNYDSSCILIKYQIYIHSN
jgi:hypothetical protein